MMEPSSKRRRLAPKVADSPGQVAIAQQNQSAAQSFQQDQPNQHYAPQEAVVATQPERHDFEAFARHLQDAAMHIYNQTLRPHYTSVSVLLLRWEEDTSVEPDLLALEKVFRERYKFQTDKWAIPTVPNPSIKLGVQMASFLDNARPDHLLIIYYAGHGYVGPDNQLFWASNTREDAAKLKWDGVRCLFEDAESEILLLLDTCALRDAPVAGRHGAKQAIAAYTPDQALADVGPRTFTACLADALHRLSGGRPFNTQRLCDEIMTVRQQDRSRAIAQLTNGAGKPEKNPVFFTLTPAKGHGIVLAPLDAEGSQLQSPPESAEDNKGWKSGRDDTRPLSPEEVADLTFDEARVLVCTTFVGDASLDMTFFTQWLQNTPPIASKITVQGMFLGPPTMLLISMPVSIWSIVHHDKVCCFLGYVSSHNMIHLYQRLVKSAENGTAGFEMPAERVPPPLPVSLPAAIPTPGPALIPTPAQAPTTLYTPTPQLQAHPVSATTPANGPAPDPTPASAPVPVPAPITVPTVAQAPVPVDVIGGGQKGSVFPARSQGVFGCENCREQHLKCDRVTPKCGRCQNAGRECRRTGLRVRETKAKYSKSQKWVKTPKRIVFIHEPNDANETEGLSPDSGPEDYAASTSPTTPSFRKLSAPCFVGTVTWEMRSHDKLTSENAFRILCVDSDMASRLCVCECVPSY